MNVRLLQNGLLFVALLSLVVVLAGLALGKTAVTDYASAALLCALGAWLLSAAVAGLRALIAERHARRRGETGLGVIRRWLKILFVLALSVTGVMCLRMVFYIVQ